MLIAPFEESVLTFTDLSIIETSKSNFRVNECCGETTASDETATDTDHTPLIQSPKVNIIFRFTDH